MKISIVVQAGGESKRMGTNKALVPFHGIPLIQRVISRVSDIADELCVTCNEPAALDFLDIPIYPDAIPGKGALGGLYTAMNVANCPLVAVIACDMAFVSYNLLAAEKDVLETADWDGVIPQTGRGYEPFHAVYRREICRKHIEKALKDGLMRADSWYDDARLYYLQPEQITRYDDPGRVFFNINTPQQLEEAEKLDETG